ncbi:hypothetical protein [Salinibacterium sp. ZJ70]|uniref:hypothetical protein n=1 Tax=Salinibacterium sp. ZJ70 TaxID=2708084 RepID=UPI001423ADCF|nr:hypothetical protein [Salinibacterium sp. ZJ70]
MRSSYHDSELAHVPAILLGGPLDGKRYRVPIFPTGGVPHGFSSPLTEPHQTSEYAHYRLSADELIGGHYLYFFDSITPPAALTRTAEGDAQ